MRYWFDTEFIERGASRPIIFLSLGMVAEDGRELYIEAPDAREQVNVDHAEFGDRWLIDNVRPHLHDGAGGPFRGLDIPAEILKFCDVEKYGAPEFWAYFADYDWVVLCQLFGRMIDLPNGWPMYCLDLKQQMHHLGIKREKLPAQEGVEHHALADARWTFRAWRAVNLTTAEIQELL